MIQISALSERSWILREKYYIYFALRANCLSLGHTQASEDILLEWEPLWPTSDLWNPHGEAARDEAAGGLCAGLEGAERGCWGPHGADNRRGRARGSSPGDSVLRLGEGEGPSLGVVGERGYLPPPLAPAPAAITDPLVLPFIEETPSYFLSPWKM